MSDIESGDGLGTPVYLVPRARCRHCGVLRLDDGKTCIECDHYQNEKVDASYQDRKRLNPMFANERELERLRRHVWSPVMEDE